MSPDLRPAELVEREGGRYARALGVDPAQGAGERFEWFLAAVLYGGRISETLASRTRALGRLRRVWSASGQPAARFAEFEAALVREGLRLRRTAPRRPASSA